MQKIWAPFGQIGVSTSRGRNFGILSSFDAHDTSLERSIRGIQLATANIESLTRIRRTFDAQKTSFRASKRLRKFRTRKTAKNSKL